eukprot:scaffold41817_cov176-Amphora_coffeaeformis.AAC.1
MSRQVPPPPPPLPTLDLHGYRKEAAIRAVTDFLDVQARQGCAMVDIITGTGAHSSPAGPILRTAVTSLLQRRQMEFTRGDTAGSLRVNCQSGVVWTMSQQTAVDTKVVVVHVGDTTRLPQPRHTKKGTPTHPGGSRQSSSRSGSSSDVTTETATTSSLSSFLVAGPTVTEVAHEERDLQQAKEVSREEFVQQTKQEKAALHRAVRASKQQLAQEEAAWQAMLARTIQFSQQQQQQEEEASGARGGGLDQDDHVLEQVLRESLEQHQSSASSLTDEELQALMEQALQESQHQHQQQSASLGVWTDDELQALTEQALQVSLRETTNTSTTHNNDDDEEEEEALMREILLRSLSETVGP